MVLSSVKVVRRNDFFSLISIRNQFVCVIFVTINWMRMALSVRADESIASPRIESLLISENRPTQRDSSDSDGEENHAQMSGTSVEFTHRLRLKWKRRECFLYFRQRFIRILRISRKPLCTVDEEFLPLLSYQFGRYVLANNGFLFGKSEEQAECVKKTTFVFEQCFRFSPCRLFENVLSVSQMSFSHCSRSTVK